MTDSPAALLEECTRLVQEITPGEWYPVEMTHYGQGGTGFGHVESHCPEGRKDGWRSGDQPPYLEVLDEAISWGDARFIAAAPRLLRALVAVLQQQRAALQRMADWGDCQCDHGPECCAHVLDSEFHCPTCIAYHALNPSALAQTAQKDETT